VLISAWVPESLARILDRAVPILGFKHRSQFLRAVLEGAVEEMRSKPESSSY
jgi:metal-responsive CopG/Arc/MetJ family transcriptional regulator